MNFVVKLVVLTTSEVVVELNSITFVQLTVMDPSITSSRYSQTGFFSSSVLFSAGVRHISFCKSATVDLSIEGLLQLTKLLFVAGAGEMLILGSVLVQPDSVMLLTEYASETLEVLKHLFSLISEIGKYSDSFLHFRFRISETSNSSEKGMHFSSSMVFRGIPFGRGATVCIAEVFVFMCFPKLLTSDRILEDRFWTCSLFWHLEKTSLPRSFDWTNALTCLIRPK